MASTPETRRERRAGVASEIAARHDGVAHRWALLAAGLTRHDIRIEVRAGRWQKSGRYTIVVPTVPRGANAELWSAVWESGSGAALDGAAALVAGGLKHFVPETKDVAISSNNRHHRVTGVRLHRRDDVGPIIETGIRRVRPEHAVVHAAQWSRSDREAALVLCLAVQQRLTMATRVSEVWQTVQRTKRRVLITGVIADLCDGAHSLGELDFAQACRDYGLPVPERQVVRRRPGGGTAYLDARWPDVGLVAEIDGIQHVWGTNPVDDALRQNEVTLDGDMVLRIPVLGFRLARDRFMQQIGQAYTALRLKAAG